jgi:hypothetical protein
MAQRLPTLLVAFLLLAGATAQAASPRVVVRPLEVYNAPDVEALAPGLQAMLASRLSGPGYTVDTVKTRDAGDEAWAVRTTITHLGGVYSVDAALEPVSGSGEGTRTYQKAKTPEELLPALENVATRLKEALGRAVGASPSAGVGIAPTPAPTLPAPLPAPAQTATPPVPLSAEAQLTLALRNHRRGPPTAGEGRGIAVVDADRDGTPEILLLTDDSVVAYRDQGGELVRAWDSPTPRDLQPKTLSVGDMDGNGVPELFIAGTNGTRLVTQALEWFGSALAPKGDRVSAYLRAVPRPGQGTVLLGMVPGARKDLFAPGTREFRWAGSGYEETGTYPAPSSSVPLNLNWFLSGPDHVLYTVVTNQDERLELYDPNGNRIFQGGDYVKGASSFFRGDERMQGYQDEDFYRVEGRTASWVGPDGNTVLWLQKNQATLGRLFNRIASFSHGQLMGYRWDGLTVTTVAEGPKIPGYIVDLDTGPSAAGGGTTLYAALVQTEGALFRKVESRVVAYDLPHSAATAGR